MEKKQNNSLYADVKWLVLKIVLLGIIFAVAWIFLLGICRTGDESMNPAIRAGDLVIYDRLTHEYHMGDVVVIERDGDRQIRRVAAVSGDVVDVTEEGLNVNGYQQQEADIYTETLPYKDGIDYPLTVGEGQIFVLGDNRIGRRRKNPWNDRSERCPRRGNDSDQKKKYISECIWVKSCELFINKNLRRRRYYDAV